MVLYRKMSSQISASSMCLLQIFKCKFIITFYDNGTQRNIKITYNKNKRPHYRDFYTISQVVSRTIEQICKRTHLIEKCCLNYPRHPTVSYRCSYVNLLFIYSTRKLKITYNYRLSCYRDFYNGTSKQQNNRADL